MVRKINQFLTKHKLLNFSNLLVSSDGFCLFVDTFLGLRFFRICFFIDLPCKFLKFKLNMKKIILSVAAVFAFGFANAQEEVKETKGFGFSKGNIMVEGNLGFGMNTDEAGDTEVKNNNFNFNPKAGYFLTDKIAVGVELMVGSEKEETTVAGVGSTEDTANSFGAGVFARYYFLDLGQRFKTYAEAGLGFGSTTWETDGTETQKDSNFGLGIDLGMNYFVTESFAINFGLANVLGFGSQKSEFPGGGESTSTSVNGNFNVFNNFFDTPQFGLTYKF